MHTKPEESWCWSVFFCWVVLEAEFLVWAAKVFGGVAFLDKWFRVISINIVLEIFFFFLYSCFTKRGLVNERRVCLFFFFYFIWSIFFCVWLWVPLVFRLIERVAFSGAFFVWRSECLLSFKKYEICDLDLFLLLLGGGHFAVVQKSDPCVYCVWKRKKDLI